MDTQTGTKDSIQVAVLVRSTGSTSETETDHFGAVNWLLVFTAVLLTRFSWSPSFLSTDTVNLAYALESFDPSRHQPHPPGYPLFVALARLFDFFSPAPEVTLWFISVAVTIASALVIHLLADRMVSRWAAHAAVILFLLNPILWFGRLRSPLRPWLALFSLLVAYCAWRCWNGERKFVLYGAVALGIGTGFRPDLLGYLFPLWAISSWMASRSWKVMLQGTIIIVGLFSLWLGVVIYAMGGISSTVQTITGYLQDQGTRDSVLFADSIRTWLRPLSRLVIWNGLALVGWIWAPLICWRRLSAADVPWKFFVLWVGPGLTLQMFIHIASSGHTLFATPAWCLTGACLIFAIGKHRNAVLAIAAAVSAALFLNLVPLGHAAPPEASPIEKAWISIRNSVAFGTFETSLDRLRWWEEMTEVSIQELSRFRSPTQSNVVVALNGNDTEFDFVNWRVISYYLSQQPLVVLGDHLPIGHPERVRLVRGKDVALPGQPTIVLPRSGRVLWIMQEKGRFQRALENVLRVQRGRYISYSDIPAEPGSFEIEGFRFVIE
jgi:hypothetical protein